MCLKGKDAYPVTVKETNKNEPKTIKRAAFKELSTNLRNKNTTPAAILDDLGIAESALVRIQRSLTAFLDQCKDDDKDPTECFLFLLEIYMLELGYLKEDEEVKVSPRKQEESLEDQLGEARKNGNKDEIIEIALKLIQEQRDTIRMFQGKDCLV